MVHFWTLSTEICSEFFAKRGGHWWSNLQLMHVAEWHHLVAKFATYASGAMLLLNLIQVSESISGSVVPLAMFPWCSGSFVVFGRLFLLGFQCAIHRSGSCGVSVASNFVAVFHQANAFEWGFECMAKKFLFSCRGAKTSVTSLECHYNSRDFCKCLCGEMS